MASVQSPRKSVHLSREGYASRVLCLDFDFENRLLFATASGKLKTNRMFNRGAMQIVRDLTTSLWCGKVVAQFMIYELSIEL